MKKQDIKTIIHIFLMFIAIVMFVYNLHWQAEEIQHVGLKNIITEIWEGKK